MSERVPHMPAIFVGHGSPMNALGGDYARTWCELGDSLPRPKAILCVSAHWYVEETAITAMSQPRTIHDFYGFPKPLYDIHYPAPGDAWLVERVTDLLAPVRPWPGMQKLRALALAGDFAVMRLVLNRWVGEFYTQIGLAIHPALRAEERQLHDELQPDPALFERW